MSDESTEEIITYHRTEGGVPVSFTKVSGSDDTPASWLIEITEEEFLYLSENPPEISDLWTLLNENA